jgi:hypothetical protein
MRIYLDTCSFQRPLDDRSQPRINVEAEAVLTILRLVEAGALKLLSSEALQFEINRIPNLQRRVQSTEMLKLSSNIIQLNDNIEAHAHALVEAGIRPIDALHVALASWAKADFFCTCDDKLLKKLKILEGLAIKVVSPLELVAEVAP